MKIKIKSKDEIVHDVIRKFDERSAVGYAKYGSTLRGDVDSIQRWLNDVQEELMDAILYLQKCKEMATEELQERLVNDYMDDERESNLDMSKRYDTAHYFMDKISDTPEPGPPKDLGTKTSTMYPGDIQITYTHVTNK